jgi:predicted  nucleic acid-binding Zn-ribbon protein
MKGIPQNLLKLQALETADKPSPSDAAQIAELRGSLPQHVLGHFDRLRLRGKKGIALVRNHVCTACHMRVPVGLIANLMSGTELQICGNCGRYLCLPESTGAEIVDHFAVVEAKLAVKPRKRKAAAVAA